MLHSLYGQSTIYWRILLHIQEDELYSAALSTEPIPDWRIDPVQ